MFLSVFVCPSVCLKLLLPLPRRLCFCLGLSVRLFVCEQDNSKSYRRILIKFSGYVRNGKR